MEFKEKYDLIVHILKESELPKSQQIEGIVELFPKFNPNETQNDKYLTDYVLEVYAYNRSLGLSVGDAANSAKISSTLMNMLLEGIGLSLDRFLSLAETELYAAAEMKSKHLAKIDTSSENDDGMKASIAFLEKIYPKQYGPKATMTHDLDDFISKKWEVEITHVDAKDKIKKDDDAEN